VGRQSCASCGVSGRVPCGVAVVSRHGTEFVLKIVRGFSHGSIGVRLLRATVCVRERRRVSWRAWGWVDIWKRRETSLRARQANKQARRVTVGIIDQWRQVPRGCAITCHPTAASRIGFHLHMFGHTVHCVVPGWQVKVYTLRDIILMPETRLFCQACEQARAQRVASLTAHVVAFLWRITAGNELIRRVTLPGFSAPTEKAALRSLIRFLNLHCLHESLLQEAYRWFQHLITILF